MAANTGADPPDFENPKTISLTVTGIPNGLSVFFAAVTCAASSDGVRTPSKSGSEPNWTTDVINLALGFDLRRAKRVSRRVFHWLPPVKPN
jgi:hypothetical protein